MADQFSGKTFFISGATRGIGKAIALRLAADGANIAIAAKSVAEDPRLGGTIYTAAEEIEKAGGRALAIPCDIRDEEAIKGAVAQTVAHFGGIYGVVNNASAIYLSPTEATPAKRADLMLSVNVRGTFLVVQHCLPHLKVSGGHILTLSPPLSFNSEWLAPHLLYTITKYNMSLMTLGWASELKKHGIAANSLWPVTTIATAAVKNLLGGDYLINRSRKPGIVADAAHWILSQPPSACSGNLFLDEDVLKGAGISSFEDYAVTPGGELQKDLFVP